MTTTLRRLPTVARFAALAFALCPATAFAADLPFFPERSPTQNGSFAVMRPPGASRLDPALQWPVFPQPRRFDIYGNPVSRTQVALPEPLVVDNGCPKLIEPTYDADGNLAGYAPLVVCR